MELPLPLPRRRVIAGAALLLVALVLGARYLLAPVQPDAASQVPLAPPMPAVSTESARLVVHVVGAVRRPGLYQLDEGERIADALRKAGGATRRADLALVNLAAPLADGQQIVIPRRGGSVTAGGGAGGGGAPTSGPVHLNSATLEQLDALPGVGPVTAQKILDYRDKHGSFESVDELDAIPGIGPARLEQLREAVVP